MICRKDFLRLERISKNAITRRVAAPRTGETAIKATTVLHKHLKRVHRNTCNSIYSSTPQKSTDLPMLDIDILQTPPTPSSPCRLTIKSFPCMSSQVTILYFLPLFLMPWDPVLRGPLLPLAFAASSAFAFASRTCLADYYREKVGSTCPPSASLGKLYLPRPARPWGPSLVPLKA